MAVSCRGGEYTLRSVCMAATLRRSVLWRPVCGGQLSCTGAKDEYFRQICLAMKVAQTSYLVLNAINQCLAPQTRTRNIRWQYKTCLFYENSEKKRQITQILQHQFTDFVRGPTIKFSTCLTLYNVLFWGKDENTTSNMNC